MAKYKQLSMDERKTIEGLLKQNVSFRKIAGRIGRDKSTVAREVLRNSCAKRTGAFGQVFNNCRNRHAVQAVQEGGLPAPKLQGLRILLPPLPRF
ncbi:MAG: helix-turn-helix domain-containing protein [Clostridiales Family XIII bacterium]|jgi:IS30 family transposase|nr:helix-turn-helix domain-containing protein [Clostridiales Family XIII bacterium]